MSQLDVIFAFFLILPLPCLSSFPSYLSFILCSHWVSCDLWRNNWFFRWKNGTRRCSTFWRSVKVKASRHSISLVSLHKNIWLVTSSYSSPVLFGWYSKIFTRKKVVFSFCNIFSSRQLCIKSSEIFGNSFWFHRSFQFSHEFFENKESLRQAGFLIVLELIFNWKAKDCGSGYTS